MEQVCIPVTLELADWLARACMHGAPRLVALVVHGLGLMLHCHCQNVIRNVMLIGEKARTVKKAPKLGEKWPKTTGNRRKPQQGAQKPPEMNGSDFDHFCQNLIRNIKLVGEPARTVKKALKSGEK